MSEARLVIAFDAECLMCSRAIRFVAAHDRHDRIRFTRLQDPRGAAMAERAGTAPLDSMLVEAAGTVHSRSDAVLQILRVLGGPWQFAAVPGKWIPRHLRDALYDFIARRRYQWFGRGDACAVPGDALTRRLLPPP